MIVCFDVLMIVCFDVLMIVCFDVFDDRCFDVLMTVVLMIVLMIGRARGSSSAKWESP